MLVLILKPYSYLVTWVHTLMENNVLNITVSQQDFEQDLFSRMFEL